MYTIKKYSILFILIVFSIPTLYAQIDDDEKVSPPSGVEIEADEPVTTNYNYDSYYDRRNYNEARINELKKRKEFQYEDEIVRKIEFGPGGSREGSGGSGYGSGSGSGGYSGSGSGAGGSGSGAGGGTGSGTTPGGSGNGSGTTSTKPEPQRRSAPPPRSYEKEPPKKPSEVNVNWLAILLAGIGLTFIILYFSGFKLKSLKRDKSTITGEEGDDDYEQEHISNMKLETALEKAIRLKNYKLAVRIMYLDALKKLNEKQLIYWQKNKTNWDYVNELNDIGLKMDFKKITNAFDYVWYGNFAIDESTFKLMQEQMQSFQNKII